MCRKNSRWLRILTLLLTVVLSTGAAGGVFVAGQEETEEPPALTEALPPAEGVRAGGGEQRLIDAFSQSHPRLMVTDFDDVRSRVRSQHMLSQWYAPVKAYADRLLDEPPQPFQVEDATRHILSLSRRIMHMTYILAFTYQMERDPKYKDRLWAEMENAAQYPNWCPHSFLGTAELTHAFAIAYDWLYNDWTAEQRGVMRLAIETHAFEPAMVYYDGGSYPGGTKFPYVDHNWNSVCNSGLLMAALAVFNENPEFSETILQNVARTLPTGLTCYRTGGAYPEGPMYWAYGTNYLTYGMASLDAAVRPGGSLPAALSFYSFAGVSQTPDFIISMSTPTGTFNVGDASPSATGGGPIMYWFASKFSKPHYAWYQLSFDRHKALPVSESGWDRVQAILWYDAEADRPGDDVPLDRVYQSEDHVNFVLLKSAPTGAADAVYVGLQGGDNRVNHSYLSLGTFLLEAMGVRWASMRGAGDYEWPGYFQMKNDGTGRFQYYNTRAEGQNTLVLNPAYKPDQQPGAIARVVRSGSTDGEAYGIMDLTEAYAPSALSVRRGIRLFDGRRRVLVQDEVRAAQTLSAGYWFMHTPADIQLGADGKHATLFHSGKRLRVNIVEGPKNARFQIMDAKPLPTSPQPAVLKDKDFGHKLAIDLGGEKSFKLAVEFIPLHDREAPPLGSASSPDLDDWRVGDERPSLGERMGGAVAMMAGSPYAFFNQTRSYTDPNNKSAAPFWEGGTVMVPLKYLADCFGAITVWNEEAQTVTVYYRDKTITAQEGGAVSVNDAALSHPGTARLAQGRMYVPLAAAGRAFGKEAFLDESGVLLLYDGEQSLAAQKDDIIDALQSRLGYAVLVDGRPIEFFRPEQTDFHVLAAAEQDPALRLLAFQRDIPAEVVREGSKAQASVGGKSFTFHLMQDPFAYYSKPEGLKEIQPMITDGEGDIPQNRTDWLVPAEISASAKGVNPPEQAADNKLATLWTLEGEQWIQYSFPEVTTLHSMAVATSMGNARSYYFDIAVSEDAASWTTAAEGLKTSGTTLYPEVFPLGDVRARHVRYMGYGNSANKWNSLSELRYYESAQSQAQDEAKWEEYFAVKDEDYTAAVGEVKRLTLKGIRNDDMQVRAEELDGVRIFARSSDPGVLSVDPETMRVHFHKKGAADISVTVVYRNVSRTDRITVRVE